MAPRFDDDLLSLSLSVADLLEREAGRHIGFAHRGGYERLWVGQAIHSAYQEEAMASDPTYRREVTVEHHFPHRGWQVVLQGRIDGVRRDEEGHLVVEEIKSVRRGRQLAPPVLDMYQRQARLYAWMLHQLEEEAVRSELVLIEIGGGDVERLRLAEDFKGLEAGVKRRLNALIREHDAARQAADTRRGVGERLAFPYPHRRPGQDQIIAAVEQALTQKEHLLVEAPTGLGKTVSALYPVLRHALLHDRRVFVLTAKTLQQDMAMDVLKLLNGTGEFRSLRLRAKARMCANDQILCHEEYCSYARDYASKLHASQVLDHLLASYANLEPEVIFDTARDVMVCPFEVSLELGGRVQATVCDYNYAFDPYVALSDFSPDRDLSDTILVIDEIHNLVDRGRGYYSPQLSAGQARTVAGFLRNLAGGAMPQEGLTGLIDDLARRLADLIEGSVEEVFPPGSHSLQATETLLPEDELWALRPGFDAAFVDYLELRRETRSFSSDDPFVALYFDFLRFLNVLHLADETFSQCLERQGEECRFKILCKDASPFLGRVVNRVHSVVGLSATLSPPEFYRDLLGFDAERTSSLSVTSPFPPENRRVVIDSTVTTTWRERPANYRPIAERLGEFAQSVPGNCLALFPSYAFLTEVTRHLPELRKRVIVQKSGDGQQERQAILDTLRSALWGDVLLLAVAGGVFAEGVDYPGEMLRAVAVVGPCLPALSLEQKLLEAYYQERFERGFEYAFVVPGMTRVVQAAGRLIRSPEDTGIIALFDRRFLSSLYHRHLPEDWLPPDGPEGLTGHPAEAAVSFFGG